MPIFLVPQRIVYQRAPLKLKESPDEEQMRVTGFRKFITLFRGQEHGFVEHGEPINLLDELKRAQTGRKFFEEIAVEIRGELLHRLAVMGSNISGAPIRDRSFLIEKTMRDPMLQSFLKSFSTESGKSVKELEDSVEKNLDQIAADLTPAVINFLDKSLNWVFNNIFDGVDIDPKGMQAVKDIARKGSLVYVPCHKSHIDYLILSYWLYENWMSVPVDRSRHQPRLLPHRDPAQERRRLFHEAHLQRQSRLCPDIRRLCKDPAGRAHPPGVLHRRYQEPFRQSSCSPKRGCCP